MKNTVMVSLVVISGLLMGCESKAQTGALTGGALGVGAGALLGGGTGAVVGGAVGAAAGGLIGAGMDDSDRKALAKNNPKTLRKIDRREPLSIHDIKAMSKAGIDDEVIISQIHATHSTFYLSAADIIDLKKSGVSQRVIDAMVRSKA